jgi:hypothetical protein
MPKKVPRAGANNMSKNATNVLKPTNGGAQKAEAQSPMTVVKAEIIPGLANPAAKEPDEPVFKDLTLVERILKVENLQLIVEKRAKLVQTRSELERFQTASNDFNCSMRLSDSDGNVFSTSFTPGIKKVIDFLRSQFDASIREVEDKITF